MEKIILSQELDAIDYIADNNKHCKGRKIFIDKKMNERLIGLTDKIKTDGVRTHLDIVCSKTGNITMVDIEREGSDCYWLKEVKAADIEPIGPVNPNKTPIHIKNERLLEK